VLTDPSQFELFHLCAFLCFFAALRSHLIFKRKPREVRRFAIGLLIVYLSCMPSVQVQRQIVLPLSKAIEIAYKSIRQRLSRSLLVTSGIVLALAFLTSILISDRMTDGMRSWAANFPASEEFKTLSQQRAQLLADRFNPVDAALHKACTRDEKLPDGAPRVDPSHLFGDSLTGLQRDLGLPLPGSENDLITALSLHPELIATMRDWIDAARQLKAVREKLIAPQHLQEIMKNAGVPSSQKEIESNRIQTRWLIGLALLVAFVGILNAMLMSVTERFREIGTMKCLGALDSFIIKLFLIESLFQGGVGTALGIVLGVGLSMANLSTSYGNYVWKNVPWHSLTLCVGVCLVVGIFLTVAGALYPAWQAARMQPIEAMRAET
jgi:ABC-type antimicrobial peptide transport system permease subunit